jgi:cell division protein FtsB
MLEQLKKYLALILITLLLGAGVFGYVKYRSYQSELADLRNQVAQKDKTNEVLKDQYTKLAQENDNLKASDADLRKLLDKTNQDLIAETQAKVYWKGKYTWEVNHKPVVPSPTDPNGGFTPPATQVACTEKPVLYSGVQDIGLLKLTIDTFTLDPSYQTRLTVEQGSKPLVLTLDLTRDSKKQWRTFVKSSDERIGVDIGVNSVNMEPLETRWYERLKVHVDVGAALSGGGVLGGLGLGYQFGQFDLGPSVWGTTTGNTYGGLNFSWAPFKSP